MSTTEITLETVVGWLEDEYNQFMEVYQYPDHVRITNGSGGHYINIRIENSHFDLKGELYGTTVNKSCDVTQDALLTTLAATI